MNKLYLGISAGVLALAGSVSAAFIADAGDRNLPYLRCYSHKWHNSHKDYCNSYFLHQQRPRAVMKQARERPAYASAGRFTFYEKRACIHVYYDHQGENETSHTQQPWIVTQTAEDMTCTPNYPKAMGWVPSRDDINDRHPHTTVIKTPDQNYLIIRSRVSYRQ